LNRSAIAVKGSSFERGNIKSAENSHSSSLPMIDSCFSRYSIKSRRHCVSVTYRRYVEKGGNSTGFLQSPLVHPSASASSGASLNSLRAFSRILLNLSASSLSLCTCLWVSPTSSSKSSVRDSFGNSSRGKARCFSDIDSYSRLLNLAVATNCSIASRK